MKPFLVGLVLTGLLGSTALEVSAQTRKVQDDAKIFSEAAKDKANATIGVIKSVHSKDLLIETVPTVKRPENLDKTDAAAVNKFFDTWAADRFKDARVDGIYVGIVKNPAKFRVHVGPSTMKSGMFTVANVHRIEKILSDNLKDSPDKALTEVATYVSDTFDSKPRPTTNKKAAAPVAAPIQHGADHGETNWTSYICIGLVVLLVAWVIMGIIRSFSAPAGGGMMGGAPAYGGGGYGGGGFFSSLMGGMFGAAAGMWMYNNLFGGHSHASDNFGGGAGGGGYDAGPQSDVGSSGDGYTGGGDYDAGAGGGDWGGGDAGGGDWGGGGGGDFGGGDGGGGGWD